MVGRSGPTYQEERVCQERVEENGPANPATSALAAIDNLGGGNGQDDADKLVARVGNEVEELGLAGDAEKIASEL